MTKRSAFTIAFLIIGFALHAHAEIKFNGWSLEFVVDQNMYNQAIDVGAFSTCTKFPHDPLYLCRLPLDLCQVGRAAGYSDTCPKDTSSKVGGGFYRLEAKKGYTGFYDLLYKSGFKITAFEGLYSNFLVDGQDVPNYLFPVSHIETTVEGSTGYTNENICINMKPGCKGW